jgi:GNAT superfamily N-acetyltransferase
MSNRSRILAPSDVPHALEMSCLAGWNQTTEDWLLAIRMNPPGCFAMEVDGMVVATTTSIRYGTDLAWIGMVLTHPEFRGRGFARTLMEQVLDHLSDVATVKLDATEMGMPLYRQLGFVDDGTIERWLRPAQITPPTSAASYIPQPTLDHEAFGADRRALLQQLATIEAASLGDGFAMGRGSRFGPCVSRSKEAAQALAEWYLAKHPNQLMLWDVLPENNLAQSLGFEHYRTLTRMTRGSKLNGDNSLIYAGAGFEFG